MPNLHETRLETMLGRAVRSFIDAKVRADRERAAGAELRFLFARLGFSLPDLESLSLAAHGRDIAASLRERMEARLLAERSRLARLARTQSAAYDVNRHLAVRAAIRWMEAPEPVAGESRASGATLNARFRRRRARRPA